MGKMLLCHISQKRTLSLVSKEDFICIYEPGLFIARIAEHVSLIVYHKATMCCPSFLATNFTSALLYNAIAIWSICTFATIHAKTTCSNILMPYQKDVWLYWVVKAEVVQNPSTNTDTRW